MTFRIVSLLTMLFVLQSIGGMAQEKMKHELDSVTFNTEDSEFSAVYYGDDIIYISDRKSSQLINRVDDETGRYFCNYYTLGDSPDVKSLIKKLNTRYHEGPLSINESRDMIFFTRTSDTKNLSILYIEKEDEKWSDPKELPVNSAEYSTGHPSLTANEQFLFFVSDMPGGYGGTDIYKMQFKSGTWGEPENLGRHINTDQNELFPFIDEKNTLYYSSGDSTSGVHLDIFKATMEGGKFAKPERLPSPFNTDFDDFGYYHKKIRPGLFEGFISSNRPGGKGLDDVYHFKSTIDTLYLSGNVRDKSNNPVSSAKLILTDKSGNERTTRSNSEGKYEIMVAREAHYQIEVIHDSYHDYVTTQSTVASPDTRRIKKDISLDPVLYISLQIEDESSTPLEAVYVEIREDYSLLYADTTKGNSFNWPFPIDYKAGDSVSMHVSLEKPDYKYKTFMISKVRDIDTTLQMKKKPEEIASKDGGERLSDHLDVPPIYFEYDEARIPETSKKELDKIVYYLNTHPEKTLKVSAYADSRGSKEYNLELSKERASSVIDYLRSNLTNSYQAYGVGYGEKNLVNRCKDDVKCSESEHAMNRRAEFEFLLEPYLPTVYHDFDEAELIEEYYRRLDYIIDYINANPEIKVEFSSHTDSWGEAEYNMKLSQERAEEIKDYMQKRLDNPEQISGKGYGETQLVNECDDDAKCTKEQHARNRRTEFEVVD
jgi:outer membrane protein OmpA-like peptidoglycan-associated protein